MRRCRSRCGGLPRPRTRAATSTFWPCAPGPALPLRPAVEPPAAPAARRRSVCVSWPVPESGTRGPPLRMSCSARALCPSACHAPWSLLRVLCYASRAAPPARRRPCPEPGPGRHRGRWRRALRESPREACGLRRPDLRVLRAQPASAGLTGWRQSLTGRFGAPAAGGRAAAQPLGGVRIEQDNASTNAYVYQRTAVARPFAGCKAAAPGRQGTAMAAAPVQAAAAGSESACSVRDSGILEPGVASVCLQSWTPARRMHGLRPAPTSARARAQAPSTLYTLQLTAAVSAGAGVAGVAFFAANGSVLAAPAIELAGEAPAAASLRMSSPQSSMAASVFVGKFDGAGGHVEARAPPTGSSWRRGGTPRALTKPAQALLILPVTSSVRARPTPEQLSSRRGPRVALPALHRPHGARAARRSSRPASARTRSARSASTPARWSARCRARAARASASTTGPTAPPNTTTAATATWTRCARSTPAPCATPAARRPTRARPPAHPPTPCRCAGLAAACAAGAALPQRASRAWLGAPRLLGGVRSGFTLRVGAPCGCNTAAHDPDVDAEAGARRGTQVCLGAAAVDRGHQAAAGDDAQHALRLALQRQEHVHGRDQPGHVRAPRAAKAHPNPAPSCQTPPHVHPRGSMCSRICAAGCSQ